MLQGRREENFTKTTDLLQAKTRRWSSINVHAVDAKTEGPQVCAKIHYEEEFAVKKTKIGVCFKEGQRNTEYSGAVLADVAEN